MISVFDIDDTLCDFTNPFGEFLGNKYGAQVTKDWENIRTDEPLSIFLAKHSDIIKDVTAEFLDFEAQGFMEKLPVKRSIVGLLNNVRLRRNKVILLTARNWMKDPVGVTSRWAANNNIHFDELIVVPLGECKSNHFPEGDIEHYFDDHFGHVKGCAHLAKDVYWLTNKRERDERVNNNELLGHQNVWPILFHK